MEDHEIPDRYPLHWHGADYYWENVFKKWLPKGTPQEIEDTMEKECKGIVERVLELEKELRSRMEKGNPSPADSMNSILGILSNMMIEFGIQRISSIGTEKRIEVIERKLQDYERG